MHQTQSLITRANFPGLQQAKGLLPRNWAQASQRVHHCCSLQITLHCWAWQCCAHSHIIYRKRWLKKTHLFVFILRCLQYVSFENTLAGCRRAKGVGIGISQKMTLMWLMNTYNCHWAIISSCQWPTQLMHWQCAMSTTNHAPQAHTKGNLAADVQQNISNWWSCRLTPVTWEAYADLQLRPVCSYSTERCPAWALCVVPLPCSEIQPCHSAPS